MVELVIIEYRYLVAHSAEYRVKLIVAQLLKILALPHCTECAPPQNASTSAEITLDRRDFFML